MKKIGVTLITGIVFMLLLTMTVFGAGTNKGNATSIQLDKPYQSNLALLETEWYKITPNETQYYRFHILNQSVEARTGIANGYLDDFINFFQGYLTVTVRDQYDMTLAEYDIRCGYEGRISLKLQKGQTYYVFVNSTVTGNYRLTATKLADIGADTWSAATSTISNAQIISAIDATTDSDWFTFKAEPERAYYTFNLENISGTSTMNFILYQYVEGAGEFPMREIESISVGRNSTDSFTLQLEENSKYYYRIYGNGSCTGGYQLDITMRLDAAGNSASEAYPLNIGEEYISSFESTFDKDCYSFTTESYEAYYHIKFSQNDFLDPNIYLYDESMNQVTMVHSVFVDYNGCTLTEKLKPNKTYYVLYESNNATGNYGVSVTAKKDVAGNTYDQAYKLKNNMQFTSSFDGENDKDYYRFTTESYGAFYHIKYSQNDFLDPDIYLYDENMNQVTMVHSVFVDYNGCTLTEKLKPNKTYYVLLSGRGTLGNYGISVTVKKDIAGETYDQAYKLKLNTQFSSSLDGTDDYDYYRFTTGSKEAYYYLDYSDTENLEPGLYLFDENLNCIYGTIGVYVDYNYRIEKKLEPNKTYYWALDGGNKQGNYNIKISYNIDVDSDEKEKATSIKLNTPKESHLEASSDIDWFKIKINSPGEYRVRCYSLSSTDVHYGIYNMYNGDVNINYRGTVYFEPGTYYVEITGNTGYYGFILSDCGSAHKESTTYDPKSTTKQSGVKKTVCKSCKQTLKTETVAQIKSVKLSAKAYDYNGKVRRPKITVKDTNGTEIKAYSVSWSNKNSTAPGKYTATVTFKGAYSGKKTLTYYIKPTAVKKLSASVKGNTVKLSWSKVKGNVKYEIYRGSGNSWKKVATTDKTSYTVSGLKSYSKYSFKVRAVVDSYKGTFSSVVTKTTKVGTVTLSKLTAGSKNLTATWKTVSGATGYEVQASTSKKFTAKTTKKVTIKKSGTKKTTIKKLKKGKTYYVKVRAYKTVSGKKIYGAWSAVKNVKVK